MKKIKEQMKAIREEKTAYTLTTVKVETKLFKRLKAKLKKNKDTFHDLVDLTAKNYLGEK